MTGFTKKILALYCCFLTCNAIAQDKAKLSDAAILSIIEKNKPLKGALIPEDIKHRIGATHVGGKYFHTTEPFLVEGAKKLDSLGFGVCKLWFYKDPKGYQYNSNWNLPAEFSLTQLAEHPYYQQAFNLPFSTFILSTKGSVKNMINAKEEELKIEEQEYYELAKYFLKKYKDRSVSFVFQNWEGDWILRGGVSAKIKWDKDNLPANLDQRIKSMQNIFKARQDGVNKARSEVKNTKCKVYHAIEVNKVMEAMNGIPSLATHVLPFVETDMVAWSAYDATAPDPTGTRLYKGVSFLKEQMKPTAYIKQPTVFLGEIGIPEMLTKRKPQEVKDSWDNYLAVCLALNVKYLVQWELYCNENATDKKIMQPQFTRNEADLKGLWLIKPDGTIGLAMTYFDQILKNAGKKLK
ncbi:hypothetical protein [Pedobacter glucosidilyticus]|uniref:hypothetical protein n=1 Tax=Pedobacter glucosidilyticus TaxID=1122941 RepID=UPI0003FC5A2A|nr:hypothetical protein [Pedobacter glucosidilyticus]